MGTNDFIKLRIDADTKQRFKELAKKKGSSMSAMLNSYIDLELKKDLLKQNTDLLENRTILTDEKLLKIQNKIKNNKCDLVNPKRKKLREMQISFFNIFTKKRKRNNNP